MRIVKEDLGLRLFKISKVEELSLAQKGNRLTRSRAQLKRAASGELENMDNIPDFLSPTQWPASSPDLSPMDFSIWSTLEPEACSTPAPSVEVLKVRFCKAWLKIPQNTFREACHDFKRRMSLVINARGGHSENFY
ncbi:hypothetical protein ANCDUO_02912 [Ancylostoma duodenale]|uniref:Uncharacterized protein n=1 Tax=Ancylostoma duodenale TaxID=51022 RepID=A0A0C2GZ28_9BILA|nr:hypothetical protein ANCDUO_02912 [Ancylostoma duodenale]